MIRVLEGDSLDVLRATPDGTYSCVVTDPPYGLSAPPDPLEVLRQWLADGDFHRATKGKKPGGFMGCEWDSFVPGPVLWREVFRTCKPGAIVLCFAATRTMDYMSLALRLAGFEILDTIAWLHAQGMPKAGTIDKKIDARNGDERPVIGPARIEPRRGEDTVLHPGGAGFLGDRTATAPASAEWAGWSTQLAPGYEPIIVARRPCEGTATANVLKHGCGAMNIDACRIATTDDLNGGAYAKDSSKVRGDHTFSMGVADAAFKQPAGRWPKNVLLSGEAAAVLDLQVGERRSGERPARHSGLGYGGGAGTTGGVRKVIDKTGPASRFFWVGPLATEDDCALPGRYVPKARKTDRDGGLPLSMPEAPRQFSEGHEGGTSIPLKGSPTPVARNPHPTVKPQALMEWLCRLVGHPKGRGLDPFAGSGSTLRAARALGLAFDGIERDPTFADIARHRAGVHGDAHAAPEAEEWDSYLERATG